MVQHGAQRARRARAGTAARATHRHKAQGELGGDQARSATLLARLLDAPRRGQREGQVEQQLLEAFHVGRPVADEAADLGCLRGRAARLTEAAAATTSRARAAAAHAGCAKARASAPAKRCATCEWPGCPGPPRAACSRRSAWPFPARVFTKDESESASGSGRRLDAWAAPSSWRERERWRQASDGCSTGWQLGLADVALDDHLLGHCGGPPMAGGCVQAGGQLSRLDWCALVQPLAVPGI